MAWAQLWGSVLRLYQWDTMNFSLESSSKRLFVDVPGDNKPLTPNITQKRILYIYQYVNYKEAAFQMINWKCIYNQMLTMHDDVIKRKHFPRYWPFVRGNHRSPVNSTHKGQWRGAFMFTLICAGINFWVNNCEAGDLRRYRAHYDVIVMGIAIKPVSILHNETNNVTVCIQLISPWPRWPAFWQTTFLNTFSWMKILELRFKIHWNLFLRVQLTIIQHCLR